MGLNGTRVKLNWDLEPEPNEYFAPKAGMLGTVRWGLTGWGVVFDDDPKQLIRLDCQTGGVNHNVIDLCVDYQDATAPTPQVLDTAPLTVTPNREYFHDFLFSPKKSLADELIETARKIRESLDETPAPTPADIANALEDVNATIKNSLEPHHTPFDPSVTGQPISDVLRDEDEDDYSYWEELLVEDDDNHEQTGSKSVTVSLPSEDIEMSFEGDTLVLTLPAVDGFSWRDLFAACVGQRVELRLSAFVGNFPTIEEGE